MKNIVVDEFKGPDGSLTLSVFCRGRARYEGRGHEGKVYEMSVLLSVEQQKQTSLVEAMRERLRQAYRDHRGQMH